MCVISMIMDHYGDKWSQPPYTYPFNPLYQQFPYQGGYVIPNQRELDEFHKLLERAREYDKKYNEPDCETAAKRKKIQDLADAMGVKVDFS